MSDEILKQRIRSLLKKECVNPQNLGGQQVGVHYNRYRLTCEEIGFYIEFNPHFTTIKNLDLMNDLFELVLDEYLKLETR